MSEHASSRAQVERAVGPTAIRPSVLACGGLSRIDYADYFAIGPVDAAAATPEQWARAMFGDVPSFGERFIWRGLLQLRLRRGRSRSSIAGWRIGERGDDWIRLEAGSWALGANLIVRARDSEVSLATLLRYDRQPGGAVWWVLSAVHRRLAPGLLRGAAIAVHRAQRRSANSCGD